MINKKTIGIIILNYNDAVSSIHLVNLIHNFSSIDHIVVVDNCSPDGSIKQMEKLADNKVDVIQSDRNGGYSYGNNFGAFYLIEKYNVDLLVVANPDVEFSEDFLIRIVSDMEKYHVKAASGYMTMPTVTTPISIRSPQINSFWRETLDCTVILKRFFPFRGNAIIRNTGIKFVEWIPGSLFIIESCVYQELDGLDDHVFLFYEEQILGWKFLQSNYKMLIDTDISYLHNHSVSINKSIKRYGQIKQLYKSKYYFFTKYVKINTMQKFLMQIVIFYGLHIRKLLYKVL